MIVAESISAFLPSKQILNKLFSFSNYVVALLFTDFKRNKIQVRTKVLNAQKVEGLQPYLHPSPLSSLNYFTNQGN